MALTHQTINAIHYISLWRFSQYTFMVKKPLARSAPRMQESTTEHPGQKLATGTIVTKKSARENRGAKTKKPKATAA
ncbi:hypothetical protein CR970_01810 [Candidatus Saccharibacteria bacterium]|nr:MAG: hypothetical protein CR970_01810 [Candidatus Saccharibacteria bacterium]